MLNNYLPWVVAPFFGHTPETYYSHHIGMHHPENNLEDDESSTMPFQRDSFRSFLAYFGQFFVYGVHNLLGYLRRKNRPKLVTRAMTGEILYGILCTVLFFVNWPATVLVFFVSGTDLSPDCHDGQLDPTRLCRWRRPRQCL